MKLLSVLGVLLLAAVVWLVQPSPIDAAAWNPPPKPALEGPWQPNQRLQQADLLARGAVAGPEAVAVSPGGQVYAGTGDGWIIRLAATGANGGKGGANGKGGERGNDRGVERWVQTGGRPLGLAFDADANLIVADAVKGLLAIAPDGTVTTLATGADGVPFGFTDDLDIAGDGSIYFSDASVRFGPADYQLDLLEARPHERLLKYDPQSGRVRVLVGGLYFANGVALDAQERFVLVNETGRYRVLRYWLKGERAGSLNVFVDNLPGFPDNIARDDQDRFWLALPSLRVDSLDQAHPHPWLKEQIARLPAVLQPAPVRYGLVALLSPEGQVLGSLHDPGGDHLREITSVEPVGDLLYFGSLHNDRIGRLRVPAVWARDVEPVHQRNPEQ